MGAATAIETERLTLRPLRMDDAAEVAAGIGDVRVLRNLTSPPYPYALSDAEWFIRENAHKPGHYAICRDGLIGVITLRPRAEGGADDLGYWLAVDHWGQGLMTEAATAVVTRHFAASDATLTSGHVLDNAGSRNVLCKLGFRDTNRAFDHIPARGEDCELQRMELTRADWAFARDPKIETARLVQRPLTKADAPALSALAEDIDVVRMLGSVSHPFPVAEAEAWIAARRYKGHPAGVFGIWRDDVLVGMTGLGGDPVSAMYWLGPDHWGQGYATEAVHGFLSEMMRRFGLHEVVATCFADNPVSMRVLEKLGFEKARESLGESRARLEPAPVIHYRLAAKKLGLT